MHLSPRSFYTAFICSCFIFCESHFYCYHPRLATLTRMFRRVTPL